MGKEEEVKTRMLTKVERSLLQSGRCPLCKTRRLFQSDLAKGIGYIYCDNGHHFHFHNHVYKFIKQVEFNFNVAA